MTPLDRLFMLEVEFQRRRRHERLGRADTAAVHTSYALQSGYEMLIRGAGRVTTQDIACLAGHLMRCADSRDVQAACDSLMFMLGLTPAPLSPFHSAPTFDGGSEEPHSMP